MNEHELLKGIKVVEFGDDLSVSVCGRLLVDQGAEVFSHRAADPADWRYVLDRNKGKVHATAPIIDAEIVISCGGPGAARRSGCHPEQLRPKFARAVIVHISPFGLNGPRADQPASDLTLFAASGIARLLIGQVDDLESEPPQRPVGEQSGFIAGIAAACAAVNALSLGRPAVVDVSQQEALATLVVPELARAANGAPSRSRRRTSDGNGATVCILPCNNGYVAISPREERQWQAWLGVMGKPDWGESPKFHSKQSRIRNWDELHGLMSTWSRQHSRDQIAAAAQNAHVPSFPLRELHEHFASEQLRVRGFFEPMRLAGQTVQAASTPFCITTNPGQPRATSARPEIRSSAKDHLPLAGVRILDFSWVIAGPTATRYLAAYGADVIKVEAPGRGDPGRTSELHTVLGQSKRAIVLDLKNPAGARMARDLAASADIVIENFATGVMERFGLGADTLQAEHAALSYISASGMGRTGPQAQAVAYGTLLQCYCGFAALNGVPGRPPKVGMAWLDPMCALLLAFIAGAALQHTRRHGTGVRVDFSMVEAMLWTMAKPLIASQIGERVEPMGNRSRISSPHDIYRVAGEDAWIAIAVETDTQWRGLCALVPALADKSGWSAGDRLTHTRAIDAALRAWCALRPAEALERLLATKHIPAAMVSNAEDLARCTHLASRDFWDELDTGIAPGLPWRADFERALSVAPALGEHNDAVTREVLGLNAATVQQLRRDGAFG